MGEKKKKKKAAKKANAEASNTVTKAKATKSAKRPKLPKAAKLVKAAPARLVEAAKEHPVIAEVVAAALVATAAALRDPAKARQLAEQAGDELTKLSKKTTSGSELWQLALEISRRALGTIERNVSTKSKSSAKAE